MNNSLMELGTDPRIAIQQMRLSLNEIIAKSFRLQQTDELIKIREQAINLFYKVFITEVINDKNVISITGLQGVGKTKILRDLYNLDDSILPSDGGRGEVIPVLFTEIAGLEESKYYVRQAKRNQINIFEIRDIEINLAELNKRAKNPEENDLFLEVRLPQTHFTKEISIALLPGFEKNRSQVSQRYLEMFLTLSTSILLVFNHKKYAQKGQQQLIEQVAYEYKDNSPIFALSFSEELSIENRRQFQEDICRDFAIPEFEGNRIVFTGINKEFKDYPTKIIENIRTYSFSNNSSYKKQMRMLSFLASEITKLLSDFEQQLQNMRVTERFQYLEKRSTGDEESISEIQVAFQTYREKVTSNLRTVVNSSLNVHASHCTDSFNQSLIEETTGFNKMTNAIFNRSITFSERQRLEKQIVTLWRGKSGVEPEKRLINSLNIYVEDEINALSSNFKITKSKELSTINPLLIQSFEQETLLKTDSHQVIDEALVSINRYLTENHNDLTVRLTKQDLRVLPIIAVGIAQELVAATLVLDYENFNKLGEKLQNDIQEKSGKLLEECKNIAVSTSAVVKGTAIFFGIDALDGTFDTFGALTGLLTSLGVSGSVAVPAGLVLIGGIGSIIAITKGIERIEKYKYDRSYAAQATFKSIATIQEESVLSMVIGIMDRMEDKLINTYHMRRGTEKNFGLMDELDSRINRLRMICGEVQELTFRNESYIH